MTDHPQEPADRVEPLSEAAPKNPKPTGPTAHLETAEYWSEQYMTLLEVGNEVVAERDALTAELATTRQRLEILERLPLKRPTLRSDGLCMEHCGPVYDSLRDELVTTQQERDALDIQSQTFHDELMKVRGERQRMQDARDGLQIDLREALAEIERLKGAE